MHDFSIDALLGHELHCACGQTHRVATRKVLIDSGALCRCADVIRELGLGERVLLVADPTTRAIAGDALLAHLGGAGMDAKLHTLRGGELHADEEALGSVLIALDENVELLIAVGSGTIGDIVRFVAFRTGVPYITVATAPSMDGFASSVSPLNVGGFKITYEAVSAEAIIGDVDILKQAPMDMIAAGFGDILGKMTALCDWKLADALGEDVYCPTLGALVQQALDACIAVAESLASRDSEAIARLMEALVLSGLAIQLMGNSRPASGSEHHVAHYFEMTDIFAHRNARLHGDKVGVGTLLIARVYEAFFAGDVPAPQPRQTFADWKADVERILPPIAPQLIAKYTPVDEDAWQKEYALLRDKWSELKAMSSSLALLREKGALWLIAAEGPATAADLGYSREQVYQALCYAKDVRPRFTILTLLDRLGLLQSLARDISRNC